MPATRLTRSGATRQLLDEAEARVFAIAESGFRNQTGFQHINVRCSRMIDRVQELHDRENPSDITGVPTGFDDLDARKACSRAT